MGMIDDCTFEGCRSLSVVDMPVRLKKIGRRAFAGCTSLRSLILPVGTTSIGLDAFCGCLSLSRIAIPKRLIELEDAELFNGCDSLTEISFGGDQRLFDNITRGKAITVQRSDLSVYTPKITFMDLKDEI